MLCKVKDRDVLIDDEDIDIFNRYNWHISDSGYVVWRGVINGKKRTIRLHRLVMHADEDQIVDHIDRNKLDNRKENLRFVTCAENFRNTSWYENAKYYYYDNTKHRWTVDARELGARSIYMDSEQDCKNYVEALKRGETPVRVFTSRRGIRGYKGGRISRRNSVKNGDGKRHQKEDEFVESILES